MIYFSSSCSRNQDYPLTHCVPYNPGRFIMMNNIQLQEQLDNLKEALMQVQWVELPVDTKETPWCFLPYYDHCFLVHAKVPAPIQKLPNAEQQLEEWWLIHQTLIGYYTEVVIRGVCWEILVDLHILGADRKFFSSSLVLAFLLCFSSVFLLLLLLLTLVFPIISIHT